MDQKPTMLPVPFVHLIPYANQRRWLSVSYPEGAYSSVSHISSYFALHDLTFYNRLPKLPDHRHDRCDCGLWLVNFDAVAAILCNHLLTIRGQLEQFDLHGLPVCLLI